MEGREAPLESWNRRGRESRENKKKGMKSAV